VVYFGSSKVVHMGDLFFNGRLPFVDVATGGRVQGVIRGVEGVLSWLPADAKVIPGHGPLSDVAGLKQYLAMLKATVAIVRTQIAAGQSEPKVLAKGLPKAYDALSWSFVTTEKYLKMLYKCLTIEALVNQKQP
ncbi:MAG: cyclase, partial [Myxococcota bacterium]